MLLDVGNQENVFFKFIPNGVYELEIIEQQQQEDMSGCASFVMEMSIQPLHNMNIFQSVSACPTGIGAGADHFPPSPPAVVTQPYYYSSDQAKEVKLPLISSCW